jgi:hypothetical protein
MRTLITSLTVAVLFGIGCTGGTSDPDADVSIADDSAPSADSALSIDAGVPDATIDAGPPPDAFIGATCNPVLQAGCQGGEKCAQLVAADVPFLASTSCVPDGTVTEGGACTRGEAGPNGYDDCVAGFDCLRGVCTEICTRAGGDSCRAIDEPFGTGSYCTLFADLFSDEIGLCVTGCDPTDDTVANSTVTNAMCGADNGCYINLGLGVASCAGVPAPAVNVKQNDDCYGPAAGSCYLNGCDSGFAPILPNALGQAATTNTCSRYCTPVDTFIGQIVDRSGANDKCGDTAMAANGSTALGGIVHECRFIQTLYGEPLVPVEQGMCVPIDPWYDCAGTYDFTGISDAVTAAADTAAANTAFNNFCYGEPDPLDTAETLPKCDGLGFGCTSLATRQVIFDILEPPTPAPLNNPTATRAWLKGRLTPSSAAH